MGSAFDHSPTITVPSSSTNNRIVTWNGSTGKNFNNTALVEIAAGVVTGITSLSVDNIQILDNAIVSTDSNGNIGLTPNGSGAVVISKLRVASSGAQDGYVLTSTDGNGNVAWEEAGGGDFTDGGDSVSATMDLGTNSNHDLAFRTNNTTRMTIENGGTLSMNGYNIEKAGKIGTDPNAGPRGIGDFSKTDTGAEVRFYVENKATSGGNGVAIDLSVGGASAGDCLMQFDNNGIQGYILALDSSESRFVIGRAYATYQDQIRISNGNTITYASSHPTGTHDYVCDICGKYSHEIFTCCGPVKWHDDVLAIRNAMMSLITETDPYNPALTLNVDHMSKLGVFDLDLDEDGLPKIQGNGEPYFGIDIEKAQWYTWAGMWQNRERMDAQHDELKAEIANLKMELAALKS